MSRDRADRSPLPGGGPNTGLRRALLDRFPAARAVDESLSLDGAFLADLALAEGDRLWLVLRAKRLDRDTAALAVRTAEHAQELGPRLARALGCDARETRVLLVVRDLAEGGRDALRPALDRGLVLLRRRTLRGSGGRRLLLETAAGTLPSALESIAPRACAAPPPGVAPSDPARPRPARRRGSVAPARAGRSADGTVEAARDAERAPSSARRGAHESEASSEEASAVRGPAAASSASAPRPRLRRGAHAELSADGSGSVRGAHARRADAGDRAAPVDTEAGTDESRGSPLAGDASAGRAAGGLHPDESRFVAALEPAIAPLGAELVRRQARLDPELRSEPRDEGLAWVRRGEVLCTVTAERGALACYLRDADQPWLLREPVDLETWLDHLLGQLVRRWPSPEGEEEPFVIPRPAPGGWLSAEELDAFRD